MTLSIFSKNISLTDANYTFIKNKFNNIAKPEKINNPRISVDVSDKAGKVDSKFQLNLDGENIFIEASEHDFMTSVDSLMRKIEKKFVSLKDKKGIRLYKP